MREGPRVSPSSRPRCTARFNTASSSQLLTSFSTQQPAPHARVLRRVHREAGPAGSQHEARVRHLPRGHEPHHVHAPVRRRAASRTPNVPECGRPHAPSTCSATRDRHGRSTACSPQARRTVRCHGWYGTISRPVVLFVRPLSVVTRVVPHLRAPRPRARLGRALCQWSILPDVLTSNVLLPPATSIVRNSVDKTSCSPCARSLGHRAHCWRVAEALYLVPRGTRFEIWI